MRVGIATDHGGFGLEEEPLNTLKAAGHEVVAFGAHADANSYPDYMLPLARAVIVGHVEHGIAICGSGAGAPVRANKLKGIRAASIHDHFSAKQGVEDDHLNILCMGARAAGPLVAWDLVDAFLNARFSQEPRQLGDSARLPTPKWKPAVSF